MTLPRCDIEWVGDHPPYRYGMGIIYITPLTTARESSTFMA